MSINSEEFRAALSHFASGVTVVTTANAAGDFHGITVSAFCSVSLDPPLILICIEKSTASHYAFGESELFVVNLLNEGQVDVSERFAAPYMDKFEDIEFEIGNIGLPILKDALAVLECRLIRSFDGGDHSIFVGEIQHSTTAKTRPLVYFRGEYRNLVE